MCGKQSSDIAELAKDWGVSEHDVKAFAQGIINDLEKDKMAEAFLEFFVDENQSYHVQRIIEAYGMQQVKKFDSFRVQLKTNQEAKKLFEDAVYSLLKDV